MGDIRWPKARGVLYAFAKEPNAQVVATADRSGKYSGNARNPTLINNREVSRGELKQESPEEVATERKGL